MKTKDKLVQRVIDRIAKRSDKGIKKFGNTMVESKKPMIAWINDTQEELADAIIYLEKVKLNMEEDSKLLEDSFGGTI